MFEIFWLPEVPGCDKYFAFGFEMVLDLFENKKLVFLGRKVVKNSNAKDIVVLRQLFPS